MYSRLPAASPINPPNKRKVLDLKGKKTGVQVKIKDNRPVLDRKKGNSVELSVNV